MRDRHDSERLSDCGRAPDSDHAVLSLAGREHKVDEIYSRGGTPIVFNMILIRRKSNLYFSLRQCEFGI